MPVVSDRAPLAALPGPRCTAAAARARRAFPWATPSSPRSRDARPIDMDGLPDDELTVLTDAAWMCTLGVLGVWGWSVGAGRAWSAAEEGSSAGLGVEAWRGSWSGASEPERFMWGRGGPRLGERWMCENQGLTNMNGSNCCVVRA